MTRLHDALGTITETTPPAEIRSTIDQVTRHIDGQAASYAGVRLDLSGITDFTRRVYEALGQTRPGETLSYAQLAKRAGSPRAARAVGRAMATNPIPVIVPCHRVVAADGKVGGFSAYGGTTTKAKLLEAESNTSRPQASLFDGSASLPFDHGKAVRALKQADKPLAAVIARVGPFGLRLKKAPSTFAALSEAIVYQQLNARAAQTIYRRLLGLFPRRRSLRPEDIRSTSDPQLRAAGLSRSKLAALNDLAHKTLAGEVPPLLELRRMTDESVIKDLTKVRGVGRWTVEMLLMFQLGRPDVLPASDLGIRKGFARAFRHKSPATPQQVVTRGERWRPWRTVASWYLWRLLDD